jgi:radical SAM/Cys-rich protein
MSREVMDRILGFCSRHPVLMIDITGGAPEMNPNFKYLVDHLINIIQRIMVRTNLTVFFEAGLEFLPQWYAEHKITLVTSLPCYLQENVDSQRGLGVYDKSIRALKLLNELGYGKDEDLELNLVYNPNTPALPGAQQELESAYKQYLKDKHSIEFNRLFTITNAPVGRFREFLEKNGQFDEYIETLKSAFNSSAACNIMCRNLISIDWQGLLYNCDFNQALGLPLTREDGQLCTVDQLEELLKGNIRILTGQHCFCCTAGAGSSCNGSLVK